MDVSMLTVALLACPLVFSLIMAALPKTTSYNVFAGLNTISVAATLVLSVVTAGTMLSSGQNIDALGLWLHLDSLSSIFVLLVGIIGFITGVYSISYIKIDIEEKTMPAERTKQYYALFSLFVFTMLLACLSNNIILTWAAVEATTLSTVFLVGIYKNKQALEASWKYAMVCTAGVAFGLFGTLLIYANAADIMPNAHEAAFLTSIMPYADQFDPMLVRLAFAFIVIGFGTKAGLFPMHTWLPDAHSQAPSPVSALLSGVLLKCAMLVIIRFYSLSIITVGDTYPRTLLLILGTLSILVAALCIFKQDDIKRRFAYSSVDNVGVVALCLGIGGPLGIAACLLHCIFHGFTKALAFCMAGNIQHIYHTRDLNKIKGVVEIAPLHGSAHHHRPARARRLPAVRPVHLRVPHLRGRRPVRSHLGGRARGHWPHRRVLCPYRHRAQVHLRQGARGHEAPRGARPHDHPRDRPRDRGHVVRYRHPGRHHERRRGCNVRRFEPERRRAPRGSSLPHGVQFPDQDKRGELAPWQNLKRRTTLVVAKATSRPCAPQCRALSRRLSGSARTS